MCVCVCVCVCVTSLCSVNRIPLGSVDPQALLTRSMRMFWDEDNAWYGGAFESYDADSGKHTVRYDDGAAEEVVVGDERFRTKMLPGESLMNEREENGIATAATSITTTTTAMEGGEIPADVDASPADTGPRIMCKTSTTTDVRPGEPVLAKMKGFPLWPARVLARADAAEIMPVLKMKEKQIPVLFFGTAEVASMDASQLLRIDNECRRVKAGKMMWTKAEMKKKRLPEAIKQLLHYLKTGTIPDIMSCLNILEEVDAAPEAIVTSAFDEVETAIAGMKLSDATFPLRIPGRWPVTIISLGAIQYIRPEFHTARHIYPVGYEVERITKSSLSQWADAPHILSVLEGDEGPVFCVSVSSSGDDSVHDVVVAREMSPVKLWHDVFYDGQQKIRKSGLLYLLNIYGLTSRPIVNLIQQLPNADRCERYGNWLHEKPPVPPPNEEMIEVAAAAAAAKLQLPPGVEGIPMTWPPNTCAVCDIAEEYDDNLLVQCDKCRMTVHQLCYGIKKFPDGVWLCNVCKLGLDKPPPCIACPMIGGPLKPTTDGRFIHLSCMTWIPETKAMNTETMEPISVGNIPKERYKLRCQICRVHYGACVQCVGACYASFHPMCARNHPDYGLEVLDSKDGAKLAAAFKDAARKSKSRKKKAAAVTSAAQTVTTTAASPDREGGEGSPLQEDGGGMDLNGGTFCLHAYCPKHKPLKNDIFSTTGRLSLLPPQPPVCHEVPSSSPPPPPPPPTLATAATTCTPGDTEKAVTTPGAYAPGVCSRMRVVGNSRKRLEPEEMAAAIKKRLVVKSLPYVVTGRRIEDPLSRHISTVMSPEVFARRVAERNARVYVGGGSSDDNGGDESKADGAQRLSVLRSTPTLGVGSREGLLSMSERFTRMHETLGERLTNGKSCIHGWGVFTKVPHLAGDMMIEYCGDLVRLEVAENRENRLYDKLVGAGTYVFRLDRLQCVDATRAGNMAHLINHSCEPNCFSRTITVHGTNHVVIFALRDIGVGEELSYDYRFSNDRETLACNCGAPKCRGIVNRESPHVDIPMDGAAIRVPTSQLVPIPR